MKRAATSGVDCMEHAEFLWPDGRMEFHEPTASMMADSGMYVSPTLPAYGYDTILRLTAARQTRHLTEVECRALTRAANELGAMLESFGRMLSIGLGPRMVGGTDAGCADFSFGHMDYCMTLMERGGMDRMQAIRACTSVAAEAVGLGGTVGTLTAGTLADIVILGADPLARIEAAGDVRAVIKEGRTAVSRLAELPATP